MVFISRVLTIISSVHRRSTTQAAEQKAGRPGRRITKSSRLTERGVEVLAGSLGDRSALGAAMRGVLGVRALTTPFEAGVDAEAAQGRAIVAVPIDAQVPPLVFSSVAGANQHTGVPHFDSKAVIEAELASTGFSYTITAPTYFFDNALGGTDRIQAGILDLSLPPNHPLQQLARQALVSCTRNSLKI